MIKLAGFEITRIADTPWQKRVRFDGRESRFAMYNDDLENGLRMSIVEYPVGSVEPRHVHPGTHATTVVKGRALIDGLELKPLDVILGPSHEPHGPLEYPDSCTLFSCFQGSNDHSEVQQLGSERHYRLIQADKLAWAKSEGGVGEGKTLVDHGAGRLLLRAVRFAPGSTLACHTHPYMRASLIVAGGAEIEGESFGVWDFLYQRKGVEHGPLHFPLGATLLSVAMR
jgi:quercetin dioxygenase-like cupin family protein